MTISLIATPGTSTANTFCTLASADEFLEQNIHTYSAWASASTADRNACLVWATRLLCDQMTWSGAKSDPLGIDSENQALCFPRENLYDKNGDAIDEDLIPKFLVEATAEYARYLRTDDRTADPDTIGFKKIKAGSLELEIDKWDRKETLPDSVWEMIRFYGNRATSKMRTLELM